MKARILEVEDEINDLVTEVVVPLRHKEINEEGFRKLFTGTSISF
ncbi:hypothetical protein ACFQZE_08210 [Paenibacillus sp. GCM10027627]